MPNNFFVEEIDPQCSAKEHMLIEADQYEEFLKLLNEIFKEDKE
jgi:hypothetical protein